MELVSGGLVPRGPAQEPAMFKFALFFLIVSLVAGAVGMTNISLLARRISFAFFALFFLGFLALLGFAYLLGEAFEAGARSMMIGLVLVA
jgi:hypothetical protein